ncbi:protein phosphatase 2C domain-containing protein, partial [Actinoplanes sp. NPDC051633]|uniref:protein phosphatase 2C domain-containing protein n=1 Tax=Actinoplanes sp. NPDC051633 TaxID=3155670 RepID=UPI00342DC5E1
MPIRPPLAIWAAAIIFVASLEIVMLDAPAVVPLFAIAGIIASVSALHVEWARRVAQPVAAALPVPAAPPAAMIAAPRPLPAARGIRADAERRFPAPPRFDERGSNAHAQPWLLPPHRSAPGIAADEAQVGDLSVRAASVVGPGHRCTEPVVARQDAYQLGRDRASRFLVVAVADGISASRHADRGATVAAQRSVDALAGRLDQAATLDDLSAS